MTVQGVQNMVQKDLRSVMGQFQRSEEGLPHVVDDGIECPKRPSQSLHSGQLMGIGNFIQFGLSDVQNQCIEGMWEKACRLFLEVDCTDSSNWVRTTRYFF